MSVVGINNDWNPPGVPLASEHNGYWSGDINGIGAGQPYKLLVNGDWRMDPRARDVTSTGGNCIVHDPKAYRWGSDFVMTSWNNLVIYEMHLGTYPDNPAPKKQYIKWATDELSHLRNLGVNALHLLPAGEFPHDFSGGYNPAFPFAVEDTYGTPDELKEFIDKAHELGIAVIMDVVYNHFGPGDEGTWQFDPGWIPHWEGRAMGGAYYYPDWRARTEWGDNRPDFGRSEVRDFIRDNALMWIHEYRVDGLRFDSVINIRTAHGREAPEGSPEHLGGAGWGLLKDINDSIARDHPWKLTIAEDLQNNASLTRPDGMRFGSQWDGDYVHAVRNVLTQPFDENRDMRNIRRALYHNYNGSPFERVIYIESHDQADATRGHKRLVDDIAPGDSGGWAAKKRSTLGIAMLMTSPGIPMILQGQEMNEWIPFGIDRRMNWDNLKFYFNGIYHLVGDLIRLRRNWHNNTRGLSGSHVHVCCPNEGENPDDKVVVYHRWKDGGAGDDVMVILNFSHRGYPDYRIGFPHVGHWWVRFNSDAQGYSPDFGNFWSYDTYADPLPWQNMPCSGRVGIGPYSAIILSQ